MDIKDFILIGGGLLIAMVVGHGFWIAWRAKREPLRLDIVPDLIPDDVDEIERLRGELPNGGARVITRRGEPPAQETLDLGDAAPTLMDPVGLDAAATEPSINPVADNEPRLEPAARKPRVHQSPPRQPAEISTVDERKVAANSADGEAPTVKDVELGEQPLRTTPRRRDARQRDPETEPAAQAPVEELLIINILAPRGERFEGEGLVNALRAQGLRYGDMNIFHRIDPATKAKLYSVANAVEPGTFDLADLESMHSPGMSFFMQLPGPEDASGAFEDMLNAARQVAVALGGELRDEALSALSGQATEHMRQRIADFARRRLSKRA